MDEIINEKANPIRMEVLRMARDLVINEHTDRRAELHNRWLVQSEKMWQAHRQRVAYPSIPPYPTESEILERARSLLRFISWEGPDPFSNQGKLVAAEVPAGLEPDLADQGPSVSSIHASTDQKQEVTSATAPVAEDRYRATGANSAAGKNLGERIPKPPAPPIDDEPRSKFDDVKVIMTNAHQKVPNDLDENASAAGRIIPGVIKRLDEMRRGWNSN